MRMVHDICRGLALDAAHVSASATASGDRQNLWDAIDNLAGDAAIARRAEDARHRQAQEAAESEAQRPVCTGCGSPGF
jgi:hypothetical protein